ncbi:MAG: DUF2202 domain-containing protein [Spirochaetales bacterium]|nr:DUF2202 domain-containing protein [Spirochaetales bacterium]
MNGKSKINYKTIVVTLILLLFVMGYGFPQGNRNQDWNNKGSGNKGNGVYEGSGYNLNDYPLSDLSKTEEDGLKQMYEEEKLARDVYSTLYEKWGIRIFARIAASEETHMNAVGRLLERYNLELPVDEALTGEFKNEELATLYTQLIHKGSLDIVSALTVGATIEDLDIFDLQQLIEETDNDDIKIVYANLQKGSRNHIRSFYLQLKKNNSTYTAVYLSQEYLDKILSGNNEKGAITDPGFVF